MNNVKRVFYDKLFPRKEGVKLQNLLIDDESISYITNPYDSEKICKMIADHMETNYNMKPKDVTIVDATACVGGDTITFCYTFGIVIPIELEKQRFTCLQNNLKVYNIKNAYPVFGDSTKIIPVIDPVINCVYMDPPWGGKDYKNFDNLDLKFGDYDLDQVIANLFTKKPDIKLVILKLPKNFNLTKFKNKLGGVYNITLNDSLKKINIIMINKLSI
jgi:RNA cap guanine-N2 methyltransferase